MKNILRKTISVIIFSEILFIYAVLILNIYFPEQIKVPKLLSIDAICIIITFMLLSLINNIEDKYYYLMIHHETDEVIIFNQKEYDKHYEEKKYYLDCYHEEKDIKKLIEEGEKLSKQNNYTFNKNYIKN